MTENEIAAIVVDAALKIHKILGPGLLESVYQTALGYELENRGLQVVEERPVAVYYETVRLDLAFRVDLLLNEKVIVEIKSIEALAPVHRSQLLTYLRLMDLRLGFAYQLQRGVNQEWDPKSRQRIGLETFQELLAQRRKAAKEDLRLPKV